jgi:hypothetical protein
MQAKSWSDFMTVSRPHRRHPTLRKLQVLPIVGVAILSTVSCSTESGAPIPSDPTTTLRRQVHADFNGPLSASSGEGGNSIEAPGLVPWNATFSSFVLCSTGTEAIELEGIRVREPVEPLQTLFYLRSVTLDQIRKTSSEDRGNFGTFYTAMGSPPRFAESYSTIKAPPGTYTTDVGGTEIREACDALDDLSLDLSLDRVPESGFTELEVVMRAGAAGGQISKLYIDYRADGRPYTLRVDWAMIACGTQVSKSMC